MTSLGGVLGLLYKKNNRKEGRPHTADILRHWSNTRYARTWETEELLAVAVLVVVLLADAELLVDEAEDEVELLRAGS